MRALVWRFYSTPSRLFDRDYPLHENTAGQQAGGSWCATSSPAAPFVTGPHPDTLRLRWLAANPHTVRWYPDRRKWGALQHLSSSVSEANASMSFRVLDSLDEALAWAMGEAHDEPGAPVTRPSDDLTALRVPSAATNPASAPADVSRHPLLCDDQTVPRHPAFSTPPLFLDNCWWWRTPPLLVGSYLTAGWPGAAKSTIAVMLELGENAENFEVHFEPPFASEPLRLSHVADALLWRPNQA